MNRCQSLSHFVWLIVVRGKEWGSRGESSYKKDCWYTSTWRQNRLTTSERSAVDLKCNYNYPPKESDRGLTFRGSFLCLKADMISWDFSSVDYLFREAQVFKCFTLDDMNGFFNELFLIESHHKSYSLQHWTSNWEACSGNLQATNGGKSSKLLYFKQHEVHFFFRDALVLW